MSANVSGLTGVWLTSEESLIGNVTSSQGFAYVNVQGDANFDTTDWKEVRGSTFAWVEARGEVRGSILSANGYAFVNGESGVDATVNGSTYSYVSSAENVAGMITSTNGYVQVNAWGDVEGNISTTAPYQNIKVLSGGTVAASINAANGTATVLAALDIDGYVTGDKGATVEALGRVTGQVDAPNGSVTRRDSATQDGQPIFTLADALSPNPAPPGGQVPQTPPEDTLDAQKIEMSSRLDFQKIPFYRVQQLLSDPAGLAYRIPLDQAQNLAASRYVYVADVLPGGRIYYMILEPVRVSKKLNSSGTSLNGRLEDDSRSLLNESGPIGLKNDYYRVVKFVPEPDVPEGLPPSAKLANYRKPSEAKLAIETFVDTGETNTFAQYMGWLETGLLMVPFISAADNFTKGNYKEAAIALAGDAAFFLTGPLATTARTCRDARRMMLAGMMIDGSIAAVRAQDGVNALIEGNQAQALGYFGEATLRLLGVGMTAIQRMKTACFVAGTPILTPDGHKPIESFRTGDLILSRDEDDSDAPAVVRRVVRVFERHSEVVDLYVEGRAISTTAEHPFYAAGKGWRLAKELVRGDELLTHDGRRIPVDGVTGTRGAEPVYNLEVEEHHTYFVGESSWGWNVWAHNYNYAQVVGEAAERSVIDTVQRQLPQELAHYGELTFVGRLANNSGHGVDAVFRTNTGKYVFVEVKASPRVDTLGQGFGKNQRSFNTAARGYGNGYVESQMEAAYNSATKSAGRFKTLKAGEGYLTSDQVVQIYEDIARQGGFGQVDVWVARANAVKSRVAVDQGLTVIKEGKTLFNVEGHDPFIWSQWNKWPLQPGT